MSSTNGDNQNAAASPEWDFESHVDIESFNTHPTDSIQPGDLLMTGPIQPSFDVPSPHQESSDLGGEGGEGKGDLYIGFGSQLSNQMNNGQEPPPPYAAVEDQSGDDGFPKSPQFYPSSQQPNNQMKFEPPKFGPPPELQGAPGGTEEGRPTVEQQQKPQPIPAQTEVSGDSRTTTTSKDLSSQPQFLPPQPPQEQQKIITPENANNDDKKPPQGDAQALPPSPPPSYAAATGDNGQEPLPPPYAAVEGQSDDDGFPKSPQFYPSSQQQNNQMKFEPPKFGPPSELQGAPGGTEEGRPTVEQQQKPQPIPAQTEVSGDSRTTTTSKDLSSQPQSLPPQPPQEQQKIITPENANNDDKKPPQGDAQEQASQAPPPSQEQHGVPVGSNIDDEKPLQDEVQQPPAQPPSSVDASVPPPPPSQQMASTQDSVDNEKPIQNDQQPPIQQQKPFANSNDDEKHIQGDVQEQAPQPLPPPSSQEQHGVPNPAQIVFKPPEGTDQKAAEPKEEVNFERANMILSSINMYTDKLTRMRSTLEIQNSGKEIWNFYNTRYLANENEKTKEYIKTEYDKVIERYEKELEKVFKDELKAIMTDVYTDFIHEVVLQKMLRIEPPPGNDDDSGYEIIGPDQLLDKIVANIDNLWITLLTPVPKEDSANFIKLTPGIVAQYMMPEEDETEGNSADAVQKMSAEELKLEEFLACINGVMKKARALKVLKVKKTVIYDSFIARCFNGKKKDFDLSVFETAESIIAETFDPPEGLEPFYTYFMLMYISSALNELKRQMPENEPETELITKTFWDVVSLIHKRQNYHGNFKYFHIIKPQGLRGMTSKDFTDKVNKDFETFLDLKFNHTVIPFDYGEMSSMIYPTNDPLTYNRASGFTLLIDDCLCMVELCSSFYLKADKLDYPGLMSLFSEVKVPVIDVEYFNTNDNKYFSIVLPIKDIFDLFVRQKDTFIPPPSMIASDTEAENVNKAIKTLTESVTNTRGIYLDANINSLDSVAAVNTLNECWDPEFWKRYYTRTHMGDEEYHRRLRVLAAAFGNITLSKGFYNVIQRKNPSDLSLFAAQEGMAKVDFPPNFRFADGYIICGNAAGPARLDDMRVIDKDAEGTSPLDALIKSGANPAETAYVLLVSSKERFGQEWKRGGWGGDSGDETELFYRTTLQGFLHKKFDENTMCDELFYEPNNTVYFSNVSVYRAGINEGFAMYNTQFKFNLVVALKPDAPDNYRAAWTNVLSTAARFGAKNIVVGGGNTNSELVKEIIKSK